MEIWKKRIIQLLKAKKLKKVDLANGIGKTQSAINQMLDPYKNKSINSETLKDICEFLNISSDFILGLDNKTSRNYDMKEISNKTGLNTLALENIKELTKDEKMKQFINDFISHPEFVKVMSTIHDFYQLNLLPYYAITLPFNSLKSLSKSDINSEYIKRNSIYLELDVIDNNYLDSLKGVISSMRDSSEFEFKIICEQIKKNESYIKQEISEELKKEIIHQNETLRFVANEIKENVRNNTEVSDYYENFYAKYNDINVNEL